MTKEERLPEASEDPRIPVIQQYIAGGKPICPYAPEAFDAGSIQWSVAPEDLNFDAFVEMVERFYEDRKHALIVLAPEGFNAKPNDLQRTTEMAEKMNEMLWMAFASHAHPGFNRVLGFKEQHYREFLKDAWRHARRMDIALQPRDEQTAFNVQAMGPFYEDSKHFRYAPGDLFLLLVRMSEIEKLQQAKSQQGRIQKIRDDAFASTKGLVDFMALIVPEHLEDLPPDRRELIRLERELRAK